MKYFDKQEVIDLCGKILDDEATLFNLPFDEATLSDIRSLAQMVLEYFKEDE